VASAPSISLAIMPFYNASGDTTLNWLGASLAEMLGSDIGASSQVRMVSPDRLQQVLGDLHVSANSQVGCCDAERAARVHERADGDFRPVYPGGKRDSDLHDGDGPGARYAHGGDDGCSR